ncbi:MAG: sugar phosphate isomerase/epimerase [Acidobacteria bacterium]|nr:sugar phosphate isomerase/epimerase [Acidobacteriota bacterium]
MQIARRQFLYHGVAAAVATLALPRSIFSSPLISPFHIAVINDEITQDFERACHIASREFGMQWIELRGMWNKNIVNLDTEEVQRARQILKKYGLRVTDIASPLFKVDWPGAPTSRFRPEGRQFGAEFSFDQQSEVLARSLELAKSFGTHRVRCFDFWRLEDQAPYRAAMNEKLLQAANRAGQAGIILVLENEMSCNTATGAEAAKVLSAVQSPHLMLNWDPGNATAAGEKAFPDGYQQLPKNRIGHCHCKDVVKNAGKNGYSWAAMGSGLIDWVGQFRALHQDGYGFAVSLETHWRGAGTPDASTRQSWAGMKEDLQKAGLL